MRMSPFLALMVMVCLPYTNVLIAQETIAPPKAEVIQNEPTPTKEPAKTDEVELTAVEKQLVDECNAFRARQGLHPLRPAKWLMERARAHCSWMASNHSMTHSSGIQENIAMGQSDALSVTRTWVNSSGHNANMRTGNTHIGVAGYVSPSGTVYWCQQFASGETRVTTQTTTTQTTQTFSSGNQRRGLFGGGGLFRRR